MKADSLLGRVDSTLETIKQCFGSLSEQWNASVQTIMTEMTKLEDRIEQSHN